MPCYTGEKSGKETPKWAFPKGQREEDKSSNWTQLQVAAQAVSGNEELPSL